MPPNYGGAMTNPCLATDGRNAAMNTAPRGLFQAGENGARFVARLLSTNKVELSWILSGRAPGRPAIPSSETYYGLQFQKLE
jgi:hypothetical protein